MQVGAAQKVSCDDRRVAERWIFLLSIDVISLKPTAAASPQMCRRAASIGA
jgi:hypothetical protein